MNAKTIAKYSKLSTAKLKKKAQKVFNSWIRNRDLDEYGYFTCITCKRRLKAVGDNYHACHYIAVGVCSALRFNENNVHGGCKQCNYYKHGNLIEYRRKLEAKIGLEAVQELHDLQDYWKRDLKKWDRFDLIDIIERYK